jgi:hypothetical protein
MAPYSPTGRANRPKLAEPDLARCSALDQLFAHMLFVIKPVSNLHGARLHVERLKSVRRVKPLCRQVFCIDAKHQLDGLPLLGRMICRCRQKRLCDSSPTVCRVDKHAPNRGLVIHLTQWLTTDACYADQRPALKRSEDGLCQR